MWARSPNKTPGFGESGLKYCWHWIGDNAELHRGFCGMRAIVSDVRADSVPAEDRVCSRCEGRFGAPARSDSREEIKRRFLAEREAEFDRAAEQSARNRENGT